MGLLSGLSELNRLLLLKGADVIIISPGLQRRGRRHWTDLSSVGVYTDHVDFIGQATSPSVQRWGTSPPVIAECNYPMSHKTEPSPFTSCNNPHYLTLLVAKAAWHYRRMHTILCCKYILIKELLLRQVAVVSLHPIHQCIEVNYQAGLLCPAKCCRTRRLVTMLFYCCCPGVLFQTPARK